MRKIKLKSEFISELHNVIYNCANTQIGLEINSKCVEFKKIIEKCDFKSNNT